MIKQDKQAGFTIIELLIATIVFSVVLLGASMALIRIGKMYYRGIISSRTQDVARAITDEISQSIQFSGDTIMLDVPMTSATPTGLGISATCIGRTRYVALKNRQVTKDSPSASLNQAYHALWRDQYSASCGGDTINMNQKTPSSGGTELLGEHMQIASLSIQNSPAGSSRYNISVKIIYGDKDLVSYDGSGNATGCKNVDGSEWCAVSELNTTVFKRVL